MATSAKWRLYVTANVGAIAATCLNELRLYDTTGTNLCTGGTASSSSEVGANTAAKAFDNDDATYCQTANSGADWWFEYDFASAVTPVAYGVTAVQSLSFSAVPLTWQLQYWDGAIWQIADARTENTWLAGPNGQTRVYALATGYSWRINTTACAAGTNGIRIAEVEFRAAIGGANLATAAARARADLVLSDTTIAPKAIDADPATEWASTTAALPHSWVYTFPTVTTVVQYVIQASAVFFVGAPGDFTLDYWNGTAWVTVDTQTGQTFTAGQSRTYAVTIATQAVGSAVGTSSVLGVGAYRMGRPRSGMGAQKPSRRRRHR